MPVDSPLRPRELLLGERLLSPAEHATISGGGLLFRWNCQEVAGPGPTSYRLLVVELKPGQPPDAALDQNPPAFETTVQSNESFWLDRSKLAASAAIYAWRIEILGSGPPPGTVAVAVTEARVFTVTAPTVELSLLTSDPPTLFIGSGGRRDVAPSGDLTQAPTTTGSLTSTPPTTPPSQAATPPVAPAAPAVVSASCVNGDFELQNSPAGRRSPAAVSTRRP